MRTYIHWIYLVQNVLCYLDLRIYVFHQLWKIPHQFLLEYLLPTPHSLAICFILTMSSCLLTSSFYYYCFISTSLSSDLSDQKFSFHLYVCSAFSHVHIQFSSI